MEKIKILFITAPIGAGHTQAAKAVQQALQQIAPNCETRLANIFDFFPACIGQTILGIYLYILRLVPTLYGSMYDWGNESSIALRGREWINSYLAKNMQGFIAGYKPDAIVCTHATPAGLAAHLRRAGRLSIPVLAVITDFVVHRLWIYPEIDFYYVAHPSLQTFLQENQIAKAKSVVTGIPVDSRFSLPVNRQMVLANLNLSSDLPIVLIMGGGAGILPMEEIVIACLRQRQPVQVIAITGHNSKLCKKLYLKYQDEQRVRVLGFVDNIPDLMAVANLIVSKPGGMTCAEAMCAGIPMLIYRPIPGQEEANTGHLLAEQVAEQVNSVTELQDVLKQLLHDAEGKLTQLRLRSQDRAQPHAAQTIASHIIEFVQNGQT